MDDSKKGSAGPEPTLGPDDLMPWETGDGPGSNKDVLSALDDLISEEGEEEEEEDTGKPKPARRRKVADEEADESDEGEGDEEDADDEDDEDADEEDADDTGEEEEEEDEGEEEEEEDEEAFAIPDDAMVSVIQDGAEKLVSWKDARAGIQRQADYTRKSQANAEERKVLRTELESTRQVREALGTQLQIFEQALAEDGTTPDWEKLRTEEPEKFANEYAAYQMRQDKIAQAKGVREKLAEDQQADFQQEVQTRLIDERKKLTEAIPTWADETVATKELEKIESFLSETYGASQEELNQIIDHRFILMARDAMLFRTSRKKGKDALAKAKKKGTRVLKPGSQKPTAKSKRGKKAGSKKAYERARKRLGRSGSVQDATAAFLAMGDE